MREVYIMRSTRHVFRYKIGISYDSRKRRKNISASISSEVYIIFSAKFYYAEFIEKAMHALYSPLNAKMHGSGKGEWFWFFLPISPVLLLSIIWVFQSLIAPIAIIYFIYQIN
jgi:hypothetical protein